MSTRVWVISELYYPEETSTGYFLTRIAEGLAEEHPVNVLCSQPTYAARGLRGRTKELRNGVSIQRCRSTTLDRTTIPLRFINSITITLSIFTSAILGIRKGDCVLVVTNPPLLPFFVAVACRIRQARCLLLIHDVYPEVLTASGLAKTGTLAIRLIAKANEWLYSSCVRIIVLGRDMKQLVSKKLKYTKDRIVIIPNWGDIDLVRPQSRQQNNLLSELGVEKKFVLQYAGNMGHTHGLKTLVESAEWLSNEAGDVLFLFIGSGSRRGWLQDKILSKNISNMIILPRQPYSNLSNFLNACDVGVISFVPGMAGISVPSRMYNIMAAGKPIIAVVEEEAELAMVVREESIGWVVPPERPDLLIDAILEARSNPDLLAAMGMRARAAVENRFTLGHTLRAYREMVAGLDSGCALKNLDPNKTATTPLRNLA